MPNAHARSCGYCIGRRRVAILDSKSCHRADIAGRAVVENSTRHNTKTFAENGSETQFRASTFRAGMPAHRFPKRRRHVRSGSGMSLSSTLKISVAP